MTATPTGSTRQLTTLPNLIIPGVAKSGTTSLFWYLAQHPDICRADVKQVNHFAPLRFGLVPARPLDAYADHFAHWEGETYRLDASPAYFLGGQPIIDAVAGLPDAPRVVILLRDPVTRFVSSYRYKVSRGRMPAGLDVTGFLERCIDMRASGADREPDAGIYQALSMGFYAEPVRAWLDAFDDRATVVFFEHLVADPAAVVDRLLEWLHLERQPDDLDLSVHNPTLQPRSRWLRSVATAVNARAGATLARTPRLKTTLRRTYHVANGRRRASGATGDELERLRAIYAVSTADLADDLRGRGYDDLPAWLEVPASR